MRFRLLKRSHGPADGSGVRAELQVQRELGWSVVGILHLHVIEWEALAGRIGIEVVEQREERHP